MLKKAPPKTIRVKQSSITPQKLIKPAKVFHKKTISLLQSRPNLTVMKWNDFIESYHQIKQLNMINCSIATVNTHFKQKINSYSIRDVPYILSQQVLDEQNEQHPYQQQQTLNNYHQDTMQSESIQYQSNSNKQIATNGTIISKQISYSYLGTQHKESDQESGQNFTDEDEIQEQGIDLDKMCYSKNSISTKNSKKYNIHNLQYNEYNEYDNQCDIMKRTAHFTDQKDDPNNQQNISYENNLQSRKLLILRKIQQEKIRKSSQRQKRIKADKQFLGKIIWK